MDPVSLAAVVGAVAGGVGEEAGRQVWANLSTLIRRPLDRKAASDALSKAQPSAIGEDELAALDEAPGDPRLAQELANVLLSRAETDAVFRAALDEWWRQASDVVTHSGSTINLISGGIQDGHVIQGRDFTSVTFGAGPTPPSAGHKD